MAVAVAAAIAVAVVAPPTPRIVPGISSIVGKYDAVLLDQFGVLHDGQVALPGAAECYSALADAGKKLVVLSNTSRRKADAVNKLPRLGFDARHLADFVSSGEQCWQHMVSLSGKKVLWVGWEDDYLGFRNSEYLDGLGVGLSGADTCDFILAQGTQQIRHCADALPTPLSLFSSGAIDAALEDALAQCAARRVTMLCANPDFVATQPDGSTGHMPGVVAARSEALGGDVLHFGKPHPEAFEAALRALPGIARERVLHVGDSLAHDVAGASGSGVDSLFIGSGIHAADLGLLGAQSGPASGVVHQRQIDPEALRKLLLRERASPTYAATEFVW